jgi:hypothetical protein
VTEGRSISWYIDLDERNLEDGITLGPIRNVDCRRAHKHSRTPPPDRDAELGLHSSSDFEGKTGFRQFDRSAGRSESIMIGGSVCSVHLVTVSPARPTSLFRRLWKE